jgi:hypothetical protein
MNKAIVFTVGLLFVSPVIAWFGCSPQGYLITQAPRDLSCPEQDVRIQMIEEHWSRGCYYSSHRAWGCGKEQLYDCKGRHGETSHCGDLSCTARVKDSPPGPGPGGISSQIVCRPGAFCPQPEQTERDPKSHHGVNSCWLKDTGASQDSDVDMMVFVVGLNHNTDPHYPGSVDEYGVQALANTIFAAWPHPESVVVISSSFYPYERTLTPTTGVHLKNELERLYPGARFDLREFPALAQPHPATIGILSGTRWAVVSAQRRAAPTNHEIGIAEVVLRDSKTGLAVPVYSLHTKDQYPGLAEIKYAFRQGMRKGHLPPIVGGDFNMAETTYLPDAKEAAEFRQYFVWVNDRVQCSELQGQPREVFNTQDGNKMHLLLGSTHAPERAFNYECWEHLLEPVRMTYSVDAAGHVTERPPATREGIALPGIAHNVLAFGLRVKKQTSLPDKCSAPPPPPQRRCGAGYKCCEPDSNNPSLCEVPCIPQNRECR